MPAGCGSSERSRSCQRALGVRLWGGELPEGPQKADGTVRPAGVTTQGVITLALAVRMRTWLGRPFVAGAVLQVRGA